VSSDQTSRNYFQFTIWSLCIGLTVLTVFLGGAVWYHGLYVEPGQHWLAIEQDIDALRLRRPANLTPKQWESAVAWTSNLHGNSLIRSQTDLPTIRRFRQQLEKKLAGDVDLQTIHWIWDEYAKVCPGGKDYQRFRAMMMEEIDAGGGNWGLQVP
jgi:hypothetical protein